MRATGHVGYETVAVDRQGVTDAWTSPAAKEIVTRRGIELIGCKDLVRKHLSSRGAPFESGDEGSGQPRPLMNNRPSPRPSRRAAAAGVLRGCARHDR